MNSHVLTMYHLQNWEFLQGYAHSAAQYIYFQDWLINLKHKVTRGKEGYQDKEIFHLFICSPNGHSSKNWTRL